jgi:predicted RNA-binding protein YlqC (UPF0109 family)
MSSIDQQFVEFVVKSLVSKPDAVKVDRRIDEKGVLLELTVDPEDLGRVIGKRGATAQSIRTLLRALGTKNDARYNLKIIDNGMPPPPRDRMPQDNYLPRSDDSSSSRPSDDNSSDTGDNNYPPEPEQEPEVEVNHHEEDAEPESEAEPEHGNDRLERTRQELKDLDDLDV